MANDIKSFCHYLYRKIIFTNKSFIFQNQVFNYFINLYNNTWNNERSVEIPIILNYLNKFHNKNVLEVGNVLSHYLYFKHDIVDKYEIAPYVINKDIEYFRSKIKYDLIFSISTLEHIGFDEPNIDNNKIKRSIKNILLNLSPKGKLIFTIPLGYNKNLDHLIFTNNIKCLSKFFLKKVSEKNNIWKEINSDRVVTSEYNVPFCGANVILVAIIEN